MRILFLGDVVGRPGREAIIQNLPGLRQRLKADCVIVNGENAAGGFGITEAIYHEIRDAGADAVTLGNHAFDQRETLVFITRQDRLVRPANLPPGTPGRGAALVEIADGRRVLVINVLGRIEMDAVDCPFRAIEREIEACPLGSAADAIVLDLHAEATAEKQALAWHFDGRVSFCVGTHTHVPTADDRMFPGGTGYLGDAGMCGDYLSVIGFDRHEPTRRLIEKVPGSRWESASGPGTLCGVLVETNDESGLTRRLGPVRVGPNLSPCLPDWA
ncbi:COG1692 Calcineurin-like phosphoesterase [Rhabdaerophilaceae bacterium]